MASEVDLEPISQIPDIEDNAIKGLDTRREVQNIAKATFKLSNAVDNLLSCYSKGGALFTLDRR
jgi:hypothetical protein